MAGSHCPMSPSCATYDSFARVLQMLLYLQNILIFLLFFCEGSFAQFYLFCNFFYFLISWFLTACLLRSIFFRRNVSPEGSFSETSLLRRIFSRNIFFSETSFSPKHLLPRIFFYFRGGLIPKHLQKQPRRKKMFRRIFQT